MPGSLLALGALAKGISGVLAQRHAEEFKQNEQHREFTQRLVEGALTSGALDPEHIPQAFDFLLNGMPGAGGKKKSGTKGQQGGGLPPALQTIIHATMQAGSAGGAGNTADAGGASPLQAGSGTAAPASPATPTPLPASQSTSPFLSPEQRTQREIDAETKKAQAVADAQFKERLAQAHDLQKQNPGMTSRQALTGVGFKLPAPKVTWTSRVVSGKDLPVSEQDEFQRPIDAEKFYVEGTNEDGERVFRLTNRPAAEIPKTPKSPTLDGRYMELKALQAGGDAKLAGMDDTSLRAEAARQITGERAEVQRERRGRFAQYLKVTGEQLLKDDTALEYMKQNQPLLLEAKRLGIDTTRERLNTARALAKALSEATGSSVAGQSVDSIAAQLMQEGAEAGKTGATAPPTQHVDRAQLEQQATSLLQTFKAAQADPKRAKEVEVLRARLLAIRAQLAAIK